MELQRTQKQPRHKEEKQGVRPCSPGTQTHYKATVTNMGRPWGKGDKQASGREQSRNRSI